MPLDLSELHACLRAEVDHRRLPGVVTVVARQGEVIDRFAYGWQALAPLTPIRYDTIFRIFSMTKPVLAVAMLMLLEEGRWRPDDPIARHIPAWSSLRVLRGFDATGEMLLEAPRHAPTMHELMTHTAGFAYGVFSDASVVDRLYCEAGVLESASLPQMVEKLAALPLLYQPGTQWVYSLGMDIQGYLVELFSGQPLADFLAERVFGPLGMTDTGFVVPPEKRHRFAKLYIADETKQLVECAVEGNFPATDYTVMPLRASGGGGLVSTAGDYLRFAQMIRNGGELGGRLLLTPASVRLMTSNHLPPDLLTAGYAIDYQEMKPGHGQGYNCAVAYDPGLSGSPVGKGSVSWYGAPNTWFWIDPAHDLIVVGMTQLLKGSVWPAVERISREAIYRAVAQ